MPLRSYIICTSPRSGSTLLCELLAVTGKSGQPGSHFHQPSLAKWLETYDLNPKDFASPRAVLQAIFQAAQARGTGDTGIFGLRLQRHSFAFFTEQLARLYPAHPTDLARLQAAFGLCLFIHLTREAKLEQAISYLKAQQTGLWHRNADGSELERTAPPQPPHYDAEAIAAHIAEFAKADTAWNSWFAKEGITPHTLTYTAIAQDPQVSLAQILEALGLDANLARNTEPAVAKLSDATSQDWAHRFRAASPLL